MSIFLVVFFFAFTIFIHELGHFLLARKNGMKVDTFSIGFGPRLWKIYTDSKGTEYRLSLIPLGGYVSIEGQSDVPKQPNFDVSKLPKNHFYAKSPWQRVQVIIAGVIMNFLFAILLFVIAFSIGIPIIGNKVGAVDSKLNQEIYATSQQKIKVGDKILAVDGRAIEKWEDIVTFVATSDKDFVSVTLERDGQKISLPKVPLKKKIIDRKRDLKIKQLLVYPQRKAVILKNDLGIPEGSIIESITLNNGTKKNSSKNRIQKKTIMGIYPLIRNNMGKEVQITYSHQSQIFNKKATIQKKKVTGNGYFLASKVTPLKEGLAEQIGLKNGDEIISINNIEIKKWNDIVTFFENRTKATKIQIHFLRDNKKKKTKFFLPDYSYEQEKQVIGIAPYQVATENGNGYVVASVTKAMQELKPGIRKGDVLIQSIVTGSDKGNNKKKNEKIATSILKRKSSIITIQYPTASLIKKEGFLFYMKQKNDVLSYSLLDSLKESVFMIFTKIGETLSFLKQLIVGNLSLKALSGPIGIFKASYDIVEYDLIYFLFFFAQINVLLAFTNLLPIPVLDGGHLVFTIYEWITKKRLPHKIYYALHLIGFILMMTLTFYVIFNDIKYF